jgi:phage-related protein
MASTELPPGWVKKFNEKKGKDYYYHAETKTSQWEPPAPVNATEVSSAPASGATGAVGLPPGWVKKFNEKKGKDYYYHAETKVSQWDPPEGTVTAGQASTPATATSSSEKTETLPAGWVKKHNEKKGKDYYYHAETKTSQWDPPEGTSHGSSVSAAAAAASPTAASEVLPAGWVKKFNEKKGKDYFYHSETKTSQWDPPAGYVAASAAVAAAPAPAAAEALGSTELILPAGWVKKHNEKKGKDYYYHAETKTSQWDPPEGAKQAAAAAAAPAAAPGSAAGADGLPPGWVKKHNEKKGKDYYYHAETKTSQWDPPAGAATTAVMPETKSEAAKPAAEAVAAAESLPAGWVKKFNEKKGKHYYYNAETKTSQWDPPPGTVTASAAPSSGSGTATTGKPTEVLPAGWVKKYNEKKAKDYYYHAETKTSQWAAPEGTVVTSDSNAGGSSAQATSSDAAEILPAGWVKKFNEKKGKDYYFHAATKTSQWSAPEGTVKGQAVAGSTSSKEVSTTKSDWNCFIWLHQRTDGAESIVLSSLRVHGVGNGATVTVKPVVPPESQAVKPEISFQVSKLSRLSFNTVSAGTQFCDNAC